MYARHSSLFVHAPVFCDPLNSLLDPVEQCSEAARVNCHRADPAKSQLAPCGPETCFGVAGCLQVKCSRHRQA